MAQIQARFGIRLGVGVPGGSEAAEFSRLYSDARRHAGISPTDLAEEVPAASTSPTPTDSTAASTRTGRADLDAAEVAAAVARLGLGGIAASTPPGDPQP